MFKDYFKGKIKEMNILALDISTKTGYAGRDERKNTPVTGTHVIKSRKHDFQGTRFLRFRAWLSEICDQVLPDLIYYEEPHHRGKSATLLAVGFKAELLAKTAELKIEAVGVHSRTLKKWATGRGDAEKIDMLIAARQKGWLPSDDNEADACLLLNYAEHENMCSLSSLAIPHKDNYDQT
jgi:Holliday junction resolvasome RuvABC endonuclease subunit